MRVVGKKWLSTAENICRCGSPLLFLLFLRYNLTFSTFLVYNTGVHKTYARVAQWWSIALPMRGSRVRIPSRAFLI